MRECDGSSQMVDRLILHLMDEIEHLPLRMDSTSVLNLARSSRTPAQLLNQAIHSRPDPHLVPAMSSTVLNPDRPSIIPIHTLTVLSTVSGPLLTRIDHLLDINNNGTHRSAFLPEPALDQAVNNTSVHLANLIAEALHLPQINTILDENSGRSACLRPNKAVLHHSASRTPTRQVLASTRLPEWLRYSPVSFSTHIRLDRCQRGTRVGMTCTGRFRLCRVISMDRITGDVRVRSRAWKGRGWVCSAEGMVGRRDW